MNKEETKVIKNFLERTFFNAWKNKNYEHVNKYQNYQSLELQVNSICDLNCKYCYYAKYKDLYPAKISGKTNILKNLNLLLDWLSINSYYPKIEIFSGELFYQNLGFEVVEKVLDWSANNKLHSDIIIPTNFTFLFSKEKTKKIEELIQKSKENNVHLFLSASVDGKYCDENRPLRNGKKRDNDYYNKFFEFISKYKCGIHPMVYSNKIEKWKDNWLWFQENMKKYKINPTSIYLLEVRNVEWSKKQLQDFYKFVRFVVKWSFENYKGNPEDFPRFVFNNKLFNIFSIFSRSGRGLGCSIQSTMQLRLGDLTTSVCHRTAYKNHNLWKFVTNNNKIIDIEAININLALAVASMDLQNFPYCESCLIKDLCSGQCLGSMYEVNGDPFIPIPTVCALEHAKISAVLDELYDLNIWHFFYDWSSKKSSIKTYYKYFKENL